jgi:hypothetical protein
MDVPDNRRAPVAPCQQLGSSKERASRTTLDLRRIAAAASAWPAAKPALYQRQDARRDTRREQDVEALAIEAHDVDSQMAGCYCNGSN